MRKSIKATLGVAALGVVGTALFASPANATDLKSTTTIVQGEQKIATWSYRIAAPETEADLSMNGSFTFQAPDNTTFVQQSTVNAVTSSKADISGRSCTVSNAGKTLTCSIPASAGRRGMVNEGLYFQPVVKVAADAPIGEVRSAAGTVTFGSRSFVGTIGVAVLPPAPPVDGIDNSSGTTVLSGTGVEGATVTIKDSTGKVLATAVVGADGRWSADLGADLSGSANSLAVTQAKAGLESAATVVDSADLPIIDPTVAGGIGVAALAAFGAAVLIRRQRAAQR